LTGRTSSRQLWSQKSWLTRAPGDGSQTIIEWCDGKERGLIHQAFQIGRIRASVPQDLDMPALDDYSIVSLEQSYSNATPRIEDAGIGRVRLILTYPDSDAETRFLIDNTKNVITAIESWSEGKLVSTTRYADFIEVAGCWWAQSIETANDKNE